MESTSRLRAENKELQQQLDEMAQAALNLGAGKRMAEATMREVAEELRNCAASLRFVDRCSTHSASLCSLADRLDHTEGAIE